MPSARRSYNWRMPLVAEALCAQCHKAPVDPAWRPFCSERCKLLDLARWVDGGYRIAGEPVSVDPDSRDEPFSASALNGRRLACADPPHARHADDHRQPHRQQLRARHQGRHRPRGGPAQGPRSRRRLRPDGVRPGAGEHGRLPKHHHASSTATRASCAIADIRSSSWPRQSSFLETAWLVIEGELPTAVAAAGVHDGDPRQPRAAGAAGRAVRRPGRRSASDGRVDRVVWRAGHVLSRSRTTSRTRRSGDVRCTASSRRRRRWPPTPRGRARASRRCRRPRA